MVDLFPGLKYPIRKMADDAARQGAQLVGGATEALSFASAAIYLTTRRPGAGPSKSIKQIIERTGLSFNTVRRVIRKLAPLEGQLFTN